MQKDDQRRRTVAQRHRENDARPLPITDNTAPVDGGQPYSPAADQAATGPLAAQPDTAPRGAETQEDGIRDTVKDRIKAEGAVRKKEDFSTQSRAISSAGDTYDLPQRKKFTVPEPPLVESRPDGPAGPQGRAMTALNTIMESAAMMPTGANDSEDSAEKQTADKLGDHVKFAGHQLENKFQVRGQAGSKKFSTAPVRDDAQLTGQVVSTEEIQQRRIRADIAKTMKQRGAAQQAVKASAKKTGQRAAKQAAAQSGKAAGGALKGIAGAAGVVVAIIICVLGASIAIVVLALSSPFGTFLSNDNADGRERAGNMVAGITAEWNQELDSTVSQYEQQEYVTTVYYNNYDDDTGGKYNNWRDVLALYIVSSHNAVMFNDNDRAGIRDLYFDMNTISVSTWEEQIETQVEKEVEVDVVKTRWIWVNGKRVEESYIVKEKQIVTETEIEIVMHADVDVTNHRYFQKKASMNLNADQDEMLTYLMSADADGLWEKLGLDLQNDIGGGGGGGGIPGDLIIGGNGIDGFMFPLHNHGVHNCGFIDTFGASRDGGRRGHSGVDIGSAEGDPIYSPVDGVVVTNRWNGAANPGGSGGGWEISVTDATGYTYKILHMMQQSTVPVGTQVKAGVTVLGYVGHTGDNITVDHLHLSIKDPAGQYIDPYPTLRAAHDVY